MRSHPSPVATTPSDAYRLRPALPLEWDPVRGEAFSEWETRLDDYNKQLKDWARKHLKYAPEPAHNPEHYKWAIQRHVLLLGASAIAAEAKPCTLPETTINTAVNAVLKRLGLKTRKSPPKRTDKGARAEMSRGEVAAALGGQTGSEAALRSGARSMVGSSFSVANANQRNEETPPGRRRKSKGTPRR